MTGGDVSTKVRGRVLAVAGDCGIGVVGTGALRPWTRPAQSQAAHHNHRTIRRLRRGWRLDGWRLVGGCRGDRFGHWLVGGAALVIIAGICNRGGNAIRQLWSFGTLFRAKLPVARWSIPSTPALSVAAGLNRRNSGRLRLAGLFGSRCEGGHLLRATHPTRASSRRSTRKLPRATPQHTRRSTFRGVSNSKAKDNRGSCHSLDSHRPVEKTTGGYTCGGGATAA